jgi:protein-disulfide isomerase
MIRRTVSAWLAVPVGESDHVQGPESAPMTLVEYGDYECHACGQAHAMVKELRARLGPRLRYVFRHFPLATTHPRAGQAAEAAEAAGVQGQFWAMHDVLFDHQDALDDDDLRRHAAAIGLDVPQFLGDLAGHVHAARVRADFTGGVSSGVNGTPTFFINGARHDGPNDLDSLMEAIAGDAGDDPP